MIVRINQLEPLRAEDEAGWPPQRGLGAIEYARPDETHVYEVLILDRDEQHQPLSDSFRQQQLRQLIPEAVAALRESGEELVLRLDGPLAPRELLPAYGHLTDSDGRGRFAISPARKLDPHPMAVVSSVRVHPSAQLLSALLSDPALGLERNVRMRVFTVPENLVNPLLDMDALDDERWSEILSQCGLVLGTSRGLRSLHARTRRLDPTEIRARLTQRLIARGA